MKPRVLSERYDTRTNHSIFTLKPYTLLPKETEVFVESEGRKWPAILRDAGVKPQGFLARLGPYALSKWSPVAKSFKALVSNHSIGKYKKVAPTI